MMKPVRVTRLATQSPDGVAKLYFSNAGDKLFNRVWADIAAHILVNKQTSLLIASRIRAEIERAAYAGQDAESL